MMDSFEVEQAIIGTLLVHPDEFGDASQGLQAEDFGYLRFRIIWRAMQALHAQGVKWDYALVGDYLKQQGKIGDVGGEAGLLYYTNASTMFLDAYVEKLLDSAMQRRLLACIDEMREVVVRGTQRDDVVAACEKLLYGATQRYYSERVWRLITARELMCYPPVEWLIPNLLPVRGLAMLFGPSGVYKSFYALQLAVELSWRVPVVYVLAEGVDGAPARLQAYEKHHGRGPGELYFVVGAIDMFDDAEMAVFKRITAQHKPALIVVDTFAMCTGEADENNTRDMKRIVEGARRVTMEMGCTLLVVHHTNKEGRVERGNQSLRNACDTVIRMDKVDDMVIVESIKSRDTGKFKPIYLKPITVPLGYPDSLGREVSSLVLLPAEQVRDDGRLSEAQEKVLGLLAIDPAVSLTDMARVLELNESTVKSAVQRLYDLALITKWSKETPYRMLTEAGVKVHAGVTKGDEGVTKGDEARKGAQRSVVQVEASLSQNGTGMSQRLLIPLKHNQYEKGA